jgi:hypothetical protein
LYYGDPATLEAGLQALQSLKDPLAMTTFIARIDNFVRPLIEGHIRAVYSVWPAAASTDANAISVLWHCKMLEFMYRFRFAQNAVAVPAELAEWAKDLFATTLADMKNGKVVILGAYQVGATPKISTPSSIAPFGAKTDYTVSKTIDDLFTRGLRI